MDILVMDELGEDHGECLIVGDGNLSYSLALARTAPHPSRIVATVYDSHDALLDKYEDVHNTIDQLYALGTVVRFNVDARVLELEGDADRRFQTVVFNFPQSPPVPKARNRIQDHRKLLRDFFLAVRHRLEPQGSVWITLCAGQGGTPADSVQRRWDDTWKIVDMAAAAQFVLIKVFPADLQILFDNGYQQAGYKDSYRKFRTEGSITHIFCHEDNEEKVMFPRQWTRDISFFVGKNENEDSIIESICEIMEKKHTAVSSIQKIDEYLHPDGRISHGYRLEFSSSKISISQERANEITESTRLEIQAFLEEMDENDHLIDCNYDCDDLL